MNSFITNTSAPTLVRKNFHEPELRLLFRWFISGTRAIDILSDLGVCAITIHARQKMCQTRTLCGRHTVLTVCIMMATFTDWFAAIVLSALRPAKPGAGCVNYTIPYCHT
jgi:hypothetical protein